MEGRAAHIGRPVPGEAHHQARPHGHDGTEQSRDQVRGQRFHAGAASWSEAQCCGCPSRRCGSPSGTGRSPRLEVDGVKAEFLGDLTLLKKLRDAVDLGAAGKLIDVRPSGITVRYSLPIPSIASGAFVMRNMAFTAGIEVPFDGGPVSVLLGFASRVNPFQLGVMMFGGGGYVELALDRDGLQRFEAALEFGAFVAVDFVVASGEVHALGGVRFVLERGGASRSPGTCASAAASRCSA